MDELNKIPVETQAVQNEKLSDADKLVLELAKQRKLTALAEAKLAMAQNDNAELVYKHVVLQLYMKYKLDSNDAISENGDIVRGGAAAMTDNASQPK